MHNDRNHCYVFVFFVSMLLSNRSSASGGARASLANVRLHMSDDIPFKHAGKKIVCSHTATCSPSLIKWWGLIMSHACRR